MPNDLWDGRISVWWPVIHHGQKHQWVHRPGLLRLVGTEQGEVVLEGVEKSPGCGPLRRFADP
jgi:hypothetical protein